ncbi:MAG: hypothetical protein P1P85_05570 [Patescibacteria group bacterium]|nr:hypothetical protein [Patescibacteria group bacterium]
MTYKLQISIFGSEVNLILKDKKGNIVSKISWTDKRDLSEKIIIQIDKLFKKNNIFFSNIYKVDFDCDSPYYKKSKKMSLFENVSSKNKCGFTSWQIGEITAKTLNLSLTKGKK